MDISLTGLPAYFAILLILIVLAVMPMYVLSKLRRKTYEYARQYNTLIKAEYEAPYQLTPAEMGYLTDARFSKREFYATLLDLEQRGYVRIEKGTLGSLSITSLKEKTDSLSNHEKLVVNEFTNTNSFSIDNRKNTKLFKQAVIDALEDKGLVKNLPANVSFLAGRILFTFVIISSLLNILFLFADGSIANKILFLFLTPLLFIPITLPVSIVLGIVYHRIVGETGLWTKKMKSAWVEVAGYKYFIEQVELDNIQFESTELKSKTKIKAFPYAVALGLNTKWEDRFKT